MEQIGTIYFQENSRANKTEERDENKNVSPALESDLNEMCKKRSLFVGHEVDPIKWSLPLLFDSIVHFLSLFVFCLLLLPVDHFQSIRGMNESDIPITKKNQVVKVICTQFQPYTPDVAKLRPAGRSAI